MTSSGEGGAPPPLDPDFAGLFRPEDIAPAPAAPASAPEPAVSEPAPVPVEPVPVEPVPVEPAPVEPALSEPSIDTGRLFRSQGVDGHSEAVLALSSDHGGRLRTLQRGEAAAPVVVDLADESPATSVEDEVAASPDLPRSRRGGRGRGITAGAVYLIVIGVTVLVAFANALLANGDIGWPTGIALLVSSVYAALTVRREDDTVAIITPPIAFLVAALTAGQVWLGSVEGTLLNRAVLLFFTLADNWAWILGSTIIALVIVLVRRRRS